MPQELRFSGDLNLYITVACILIDKLKLSRWPLIGKVRRELGFYCYLYTLTQTDSLVAYASLGKEAVSYKNNTISSHVKIRYLHVKISMISVISSLSLKLYLNSSLYHRNSFGSSLKVFSNLRQSSDIFGNFRKFSENVREHLSGLRNNFGKSSESGRKSLENHQNAIISMFIYYNKKKISSKI